MDSRDGYVGCARSLLVNGVGFDVSFSGLTVLLTDNLFFKYAAKIRCRT